MPVRPKNLPGNLIFAVCDRFIRGRDPAGNPVSTSAGDIADWVKEEGYEVTRETIYRIVRIGVDRGYVTICPPLHETLRSRLLSLYPNAGAVRVFDVKSPNNVVDNLADGAADLLLELIIQLGTQRNPPGTPNEALRRVHLGFGGGGTSLKVAQRLAQRLRAEAKLPPITIHALSSGFDIESPLDAPSAFLSLFDELQTVKIVGLFCSPFVFTPSGGKRSVGKREPAERSLPVVDQAVRFAKDIDIVVTSLAQAGDKHGLLNDFFRKYGSKRDHAYLKKQGLRGDVLWQAYSDTGPLPDTSIQAFTLFDIPRLRTLSATPGKHVVAVAGPCVRCGATKELALRTLLAEPTLKVFNHLISDAETIERVIGASTAA